MNYGEVAIVLLMALIALAATCYQALWIIRAGDEAARQSRIAASLKILNDNWRVGLLLLVPLFYRTIRSFLERVEEFWGMKAPRTPTATTAGTNPQEKSTEEESAKGS